ncbi:uncharacterized protein PAC_10188 [Phialocephala subalpina]|uniref:Uncharacterized protein n=1 Tax=Phialocephala subalpina TaxID=576137 RepID=A0A1L7X5J0_9HELO|nr:uncharacterized protein PAC_10188 [Phialocephala subalpina]
MPTSTQRTAMSPTKRPLDTDGSFKPVNKLRRLDPDTTLVGEEEASSSEGTASEDALPSGPPGNAADLPSEVTVSTSEDALLECVETAEKQLRNKTQRVQRLRRDVKEGSGCFEHAEAQRLGLLEFIKEKNLDGEQIDTLPATKSANDIRKHVDSFYNEIYADWKCEEHPDKCISSYDKRLCDTIWKYLPGEKQLSRMHGGLKLAFELVQYMGNKTHIEFENRSAIRMSIPMCKICMFGPPADTLLFDFLQKLKEKEKDFRPKECFGRIEAQRKALSNGMEPTTGLWLHGDDEDDEEFTLHDDYFTKSYDLLWSYLIGQIRIESYYTSEGKGDAILNLRPRFYMLSEYMALHRVNIKRLENMHGGSRMAFDLGIFLSRKTVPPLSDPELPSIGGGYNPRVSDNLIDQTLFKIPQRLPSSVIASSEFETLEAAYQHLVACNIHTYLPKTRKLLSTFRENANMTKHEKQPLEVVSPNLLNARSIAKSVRQNILKYSKTITKTLETRPKSPSEDFIIKEMVPYIEEARALSVLPEGLVPAIELLLFIGKHSYTTFPDYGPNHGHGRVLSSDGSAQLQYQPPSRPSDEPANNLLYSLLGGIKEGSELGLQLDLSSEWKSIPQQRKYLAEFGIHSYFKQTSQYTVRYGKTAPGKITSERP